MEEPGYGKIGRSYSGNQVAWRYIPLDGAGLSVETLRKTAADLVHLSPSHHYPTGLVMPIARRQELLRWADEQPDRYILEDDYDSEFRFNAHPMAAMQSMDAKGKVIYMNTFSKTLAPSIRISYMVLPPVLMAAFREKLGFYSCTVPSFEQYTLARFLSRGHFEKHINRMRKFYRARRNRVVQMLKTCPFADKLTILEQDAGLHFILKVDTLLSDRVLTEKLQSAGIRIHPLNRYYHRSREEDTHCLLVNYASLEEKKLEEVLQILPDWL